MWTLTAAKSKITTAFTRYARPYREGMQDLVLAVTRIQELQTMFPQKSFYHTHHCTVVACACYKQGLQHGVVGFFVPQKQFNRMPAHTVMAAGISQSSGEHGDQSGRYRRGQKMACLMRRRSSSHSPASRPITSFMFRCAWKSITTCISQGLLHF